MESILIKDTTREERERIVAESLGNISGSCDGCMAGLTEMYQDYIDGKKEIRDINMDFKTNCLNRQAQGEGKLELYVNLMGLTKKIADYLCRKSDKNRERLGEIMGGKVLELESDRLKAEGRMEGRAEGRMEGHAEGCAEVYSRFIIKGMISYEDASRESGLSVEDLKKAVEATMNS